ncbi:MAG: transcriptional regulator [Anaerotignaceae bacterium]
MEKETTADRLKQTMKENNLKQVDILKLTESLCEEYDVKMNKSDISQYVAGKVEPNQQKLFVLGKALNVSEAWLMGYDTPKERNDSYNKTEPTKLSPEHQQLITAYDNAPFDKKNIARLTLGMSLLKEEDMELGADMKTS